MEIIGTEIAFDIVNEDGVLLIEGVSSDEARLMAKDWLDVVIVPHGARLEDVLPLAA